MRRFRAIVESLEEPEDHEVLWYYNGKLRYYGNNSWQDFLHINASAIAYDVEENTNITNVKDALDELRYVELKIKSFTLKQAGVYEKGAVLNSINFSWSYNKNLIESQKINNTVLPISLRTYIINEKISKDSSYVLEASDGVTKVSAITVIRFVDYIYYGVLHKEESSKKGKINPSVKEFNVTANSQEYIWIFIPDSAKLTKIWNNNMDSTNDFTITKTTFSTDTGLSIKGTYYVSKNHTLGNVTFKFT